MYLLPQPQEWIKEEGSFRIPYDAKIVLDASCTPNDYDTAALLANDLKKYGGLSLSVTRGESQKAAVILAIMEHPAQEEIRRQGYTLTVSPEGIRVTGRSRAGLFYGAATLRQMIRQAGACIPCARIGDWPEIPARGIYYDVTRGRIPTLDYLRKQADRLAFYKINQLQLYIEHTFLFEGLSEVWRDDTPLTGEDILELDAYCRKLHIDLVPNLSSFGHLYKLLRTKTYRRLCELPDPDKEPFGFAARMEHHTLDVGNPDSMALAKDLIGRYLPLFTSEYFNIGADETFDLGKGKNRSRAEKEGTRRMYMDFVGELCSFLVEKGKKPMFWGDIIYEFPDAVKELPKETICLNWGYEADVKEERVKTLADAGAAQYCCPGVSGWNQFVNSLDVAYENISRMCTYGVKYGAKGILITDWGDFGHVNHPDFGIPGIIYGAAFSWNSKILDFDEMNRQISTIEYLDSSESLAGILAGFSGCWAFRWRDAVMLKERGTTELDPEEMERIPAILNRLDEQKGKLYEAIPRLAPEARELADAYLMAVHGMEIFQKVGRVFVKGTKPGQPAAMDDRRKLAEELEEWFYHYKRIWRTVSREAELYRIEEVVFWYADRLREEETEKADNPKDRIEI